MKYNTVFERRLLKLAEGQSDKKPSTPGMTKAAHCKQPLNPRGTEH